MRELVPGLWDVDTLPGVHAYLWVWEQGVTIVDTGPPGHAHAFLNGITALGYPVDQVRRIIVTHGDADHAGNARDLARETGAPVGCHAVEKILLEHPERRKPAPNLLGLAVRPLYALASSLPPLRTPPVRPTELYVDGQELPEGFVVVHTPGHTPGHISLVHRERRILIAGDALNNRGGRLHLPPRIFTPDPDNALRSLQRLVRKYADHIDVAVFGHGPPILQDAGTQIAAFVAQVSEQTRT